MNPLYGAQLPLGLRVQSRVLGKQLFRERGATLEDREGNLPQRQGRVCGSHGDPLPRHPVDHGRFFRLRNNSSSGVPHLTGTFAAIIPHPREEGRHDALAVGSCSTAEEPIGRVAADPSLAPRPFGFRDAHTGERMPGIHNLLARHRTPIDQLATEVL